MIRAVWSLWKGTLDFRGRTGRKDYWLGLLGQYLLLFPVGYIVRQIYKNNTPNEVALAICGVLLLPLPALLVRRIRDIPPVPERLGIAIFVGALSVGSLGCAFAAFGNTLDAYIMTLLSTFSMCVIFFGTATEMVEEELEGYNASWAGKALQWIAKHLKIKS